MFLFSERLLMMLDQLLAPMALIVFILERAVKMVKVNLPNVQTFWIM